MRRVTPQLVAMMFGALAGCGEAVPEAAEDVMVEEGEISEAPEGGRGVGQGERSELTELPQEEDEDDEQEERDDDWFERLRDDAPEIGTEFLCSKEVQAVLKLCSGWDERVQIDGDGVHQIYGPQIAFDGEGNAHLVWRQGRASGDVWASRYTREDGWGKPKMIAPGGVDGAFSLALAVDEAGNAIAIWLELNEHSNDLWTSRYTAGEGWGEPFELQTDIWLTASVAMHDEQALVVWKSQNQAGLYDVWAARHAPEDGWGEANLLAAEERLPPTPEAAFDASGSALVVWGSPDGAWSRGYDAEGGWQETERLDGDLRGTVGRTRVVFDDAGNATAVGITVPTDDEPSAVWSRRYVPEEGWGEAVELDAAIDGYAASPSVAVDGAGNAVAVWRSYYKDDDRSAVWGSRYDADTGWGEAVELDANAARFARPQVVMNDDGHVFVAWASADESVRVLEVQDDWSESVTVGVGDWAVSQTGTTLAVDAAGNVIVVWPGMVTGGDGWWRLWARLYAAEGAVEEG